MLALVEKQFESPVPVLVESVPVWQPEILPQIFRLKFLRNP